MVQAKSCGTGSAFSFHLLNALALKAILSQGVFQTQHLRSELKKKKKKGGAGQELLVGKGESGLRGGRREFQEGSVKNPVKSSPNKGD